MNESAEARFLDPDSCSWKLEEELHVWKFPAVPANFYFLTEEERAFADRFRFEEDRLRFSVGRQSLRMLISKYLSVQPEEIVFSTEKNKKPGILSPGSSLHFNLSHSGGLILIALAPVEVGIDIELVDEDFSYQDILSEHFCENEQNFISESPSPLHSFYYLWTRKEALTKAWGTGLQENLKAVQVLEAGPFPDLHKKYWQLESMRLSPVYPAAIAYSGKLKNIFYFDGIDMNSVTYSY